MNRSSALIRLQNTTRCMVRNVRCGVRKSLMIRERTRRQYFANTIWTLITEASAELMPVECTTSGRPSRPASTHAPECWPRTTRRTETDGAQAILGSSAPRYLEDLRPGPASYRVGGQTA